MLRSPAHDPQYMVNRRNIAPRCTKVKAGGRGRGRIGAPPALANAETLLNIHPNPIASVCEARMYSRISETIGNRSNSGDKLLIGQGLERIAGAASRGSTLAQIRR